MDRNEFRYFLVTLFCVAYILSKMNVLSLTTFRISQFHTCPAEDSKFHTLVDISLEHCVQECKLRTSCKAVGYKRVFRLCELHVQAMPAVTNKYCVMILLKDMGDRPSLSNCSEMSALDQESGQCIRKECPSIQSLDNVTSKGNMNDENSKNMVQCQNGFFEVTNRNSEQSVRCKQNGNWSFFPQCEKCPNDGEVIRGLQFFKALKKTQDKAKAFCSEQNGTLVRIKDDLTFTYIRSLIITCMGEPFWTDGKKLGNVWQYSNGDNVPMKSQYWSKNYRNKTCLRIRQRFLDRPCNTSLSFICESNYTHSL